MKLFLGIIILILSTFIGYILSEKFSKRRVFYKNFRLFNTELEKEISFTKRTILELIEDKKDNDFNLIVFNYFNKNVLDFNLSYLKIEELDCFKIYLKTIGSSNDISQLQYLKTINIELDKRLLDAEANEKKYKTLYVKIGFLIGLILLIIIM